MGIAVAALVVLTSGVVVGGVLDDAARSPSPRPSLTEGSPTPSGEPDACKAADTGTVQPFRLAVRDAPGEGATGLMGYTFRPGNVAPSKGWLRPIADEGVLVASRTDVLEIRTDPSLCFRRIEAEYADASVLNPGASQLTSLASDDLEPPQLRPVIGSLPDGDWVVRVKGSYFSGKKGSGGQLVAERFFRVNVGSGPFETFQPTPGPTRRPVDTPEVPCGGAPTAADDVVVVASGPSGEPIAGAPPELPADQRRVVTLAFGEPLQIAVVGDQCATSWDFAFEGILGNGGDRGRHQVNEGEDPNYASENHWVFRPGEDQTALVATLQFGPLITVERTWTIEVLPFTVPKLFFVTADGRRVEALPGCGLGITLSSGTGSGEDCPGLDVPEELRQVRTAAWSIAELEVPGWTINGWYGQCGVVGSDGVNEYFDTGNGCGLGGFSVNWNQEPPGVPRFLVHAGELTYQLTVTANRDGLQFQVPYYLIVTGTGG